MYNVFCLSRENGIFLNAIFVNGIEYLTSKIDACLKEVNFENKINGPRGI